MKYEKIKKEIVEEDGGGDFVQASFEEDMKTDVLRMFQSFMLILFYFVPSIGLTFYQRWFLKEFKFPLLVVLIHLMMKFLISLSIRLVIRFWRRSSSINDDAATSAKQQRAGIICTGVFSSLDIGFSNWGLKLVQVSLYTMTKSSTVVFILLCAILFKIEKRCWSQLVIVTLISIGLLLFTYKSSEFNLFGFIMLLFASMMSGFRWTCAQLLLQKSTIATFQHSLDMIYYIQPYMFITLLPIAILVEGKLLYIDMLNGNGDLTLIELMEIIVGALIAFIMEFMEFLVVTYTSSLTLAIAGIFKEIIILILAVLFNGDRISTINFIGLLICLSGITSHVANKVKKQQYRTRGDHHSVNYDNDKKHDSSSQIPLIMATTKSGDDASGGNNDDDDEDSDSQQIIFNLLNSREFKHYK